MPTLPSPVTPKAFIDHDRVPDAVQAAAIRSRICAQKPAVYVTSSTERKLGQWDNLTWDDHIGADKKSKEYNRYLADGIIRNLAASKSKDASAHSIGLVGEASKYGRSCSWATTSTTRVSTKCSTVRQVSSGLTRGWSISGQV